MEPKSHNVVVHDHGVIQQVLNKALDVVNDQVNADALYSDEDKERFRKRFAEMYEQVLLGNITSPVAQTTDGNDAPVDMAGEDEAVREEHGALQQEVDGLIIAAGKKRKHCPHQAVVQLAEQCRAECNYAKKAPVSVEVPSVNVENLPEPMNHCQSKDQMKTTQKHINKLIKDLPPMVETVQEVEKTQRLYNQQVTTTDRMLFSTSH